MIEQAEFISHRNEGQHQEEMWSPELEHGEGDTIGFGPELGALGTGLWNQAFALQWMLAGSRVKSMTE